MHSEFYCTWSNEDCPVNLSKGGWVRSNCTCFCRSWTWIGGLLLDTLEYRREFRRVLWMHLLIYLQDCFAASNDFPWPLSFKIQSLSQAERRILVVTLQMILCLLVCSTSLSRSGKRSLITSIRPNQLTASILVDLFVSHRNWHYLSCMSSPKVVQMNICGLPRNAVFVKLRQLTVNFTRFF